GIDITGSVTGTVATGNSNVIQGNFIGTDGAGGAGIDLGNAGFGIAVQGASSTTIGGTGSGEMNVVAFNNLAGVSVQNNGAVVPIDDPIEGNSIFGNGGLGIQLGNGIVLDSPTGSGTGPNNLQNYPVLGSVGSNTVVTGTLTGSAG